MCTVSVVKLWGKSRIPADTGPSAEGAVIRIGCNRDESRARPAASPPEIRRCGSVRAIFPVDPISDGTWFGVNELGVAAALLNVYPGPPPARYEPTPPRVMSRGVIVPRLMQFDSAARAADALTHLEVSQYPPFRTVVFDEHTVVEARSDGHRLSVFDPFGYDRPLMFTSSGLGDELVEGPRRSLFEASFAPRLVGRTPAAADCQDEFHRHRWGGQPELSVCMERADARTVSYSVVDISSNYVALIYYPDSPHLRPAPVRMELDRRATP